MTREQLKKDANKVAEIMQEGYCLPMTEYKIRTALNNLEAMASLIARLDTYIDELEAINKDLNIAVDMNMELNIKKLEQALIATKGK